MQNVGWNPKSLRNKAVFRVVLIFYNKLSSSASKIDEERSNCLFADYPDKWYTPVTGLLSIHKHLNKIQMYNNTNITDTSDKAI